jgi:hypothetical protein
MYEGRSIIAERYRQIGYWFSGCWSFDIREVYSILARVGVLHPIFMRTLNTKLERES